MNQSDREWLSRIDERTLNIWRVVEKMEAHAEEQNGYIRDNLKATSSNTTWRRALLWIIPISFTLIIGWLLLLTF